MEKEQPSVIVIEMLSQQLKKKKEELTPEKRIKEDLGADSLDVVELIMAIEERFKVTVADNSAAGIKTVGDLMKFVDSFK